MWNYVVCWFICGYFSFSFFFLPYHCKPYPIQVASLESMYNLSECMLYNCWYVQWFMGTQRAPIQIFPESPDSPSFLCFLQNTQHNPQLYRDSQVLHLRFSPTPAVSILGLVQWILKPTCSVVDCREQEIAISPTALDLHFSHQQTVKKSRNVVLQGSFIKYTVEFALTSFISGDMVIFILKYSCIFKEIFQEPLLLHSPIVSLIEEGEQCPKFEIFIKSLIL